MAIYEKRKDGTRLDKISSKYDISKSIILRYYNIWAEVAPKIQLQSSRDILISLCPKGRSIVLTRDEEKLIIETVTYYATNLTPLSRTIVIELARTVINYDKSTHEDNIHLNRGWLDGFLKRYDELKIVAL